MIGKLQQVSVVRRKNNASGLTGEEGMAEARKDIEEGLELLSMLLDDTYHGWMHKAPEMPPIDTKKGPKKSGGRGGRRRSGRRRR